MSLFGKNRDFEMIKLINKELIGKVIEQKIGYYKIILEESTSNVYGEAPIKKFRNPVLIDCLIVRGDMNEVINNDLPDVEKNITVRFLRQHLVEADVVPEIGDIIFWQEHYYEVSLNNENQLFVGKDPAYSYADTSEDFGGSLSIILTCHYKRAESLGLKQER
jgi:hypothetical protein